MKTITLTQATYAELAGATNIKSQFKAIAAQIADGATYDGTNNFVGGYALPTEFIGMVADLIDTSNPLTAYSQTLNVSSVGAGGIEIKQNLWGAFDEKEQYGVGDIQDIGIKTEWLPWSKPFVKKEGITAYDLNRGVPNVLLEKLEGYTIRGYNKFIEKGIAEMVGSSAVVAQLPASIASTKGLQEDALQTFDKLVEEAEKLVKRVQCDASDVTITIDNILFQKLAMAGFIGDRVTETMANGRMTVGTIGGYRIQGSSKISGTAGSGTPTAVKAIIGTSRCLATGFDIIAANAGKVDSLSNDQAFYNEMAFLVGVPEYAVESGKEEITLITANA